MEQETIERAAVEDCMTKHMGDIVDSILHSHREISEIVIADSHASTENLGSFLEFKMPR